MIADENEVGRVSRNEVEGEVTKAPQPAVRPAMQPPCTASNIAQRAKVHTEPDCLGSSASSCVPSPTTFRPHGFAACRHNCALLDSAKAISLFGPKSQHLARELQTIADQVSLFHCRPDTDPWQRYVNT